MSGIFDAFVLIPLFLFSQETTEFLNFQISENFVTAQLAKSTLRLLKKPDLVKIKPPV